MYKIVYCAPLEGGYAKFESRNYGEIIQMHIELKRSKSIVICILDATRDAYLYKDQQYELHQDDISELIKHNHTNSQYLNY